MQATRSAGDALWQATAAMHATAVPLMARVLPDHCSLFAYQHYPMEDVINGAWQARWFYHSHNPGELPDGEHGHFHLFVSRGAFPKNMHPLISPPAGRRPRPSTVHIAALAMDANGLPSRWFVPNRWVTNEWLYPAQAIISLMADISFLGGQGDPLVNAWLDTMLAASRREIADLLTIRDMILLQQDPDGEDRAMEVIAQSRIDLDALLDR